MKSLSEQILQAALTGDSELLKQLKTQRDNRFNQERERSISPKFLKQDPFSDITPAIEIDKRLNKIFGKDWYTWELETLWKMFLVQGVMLPSENVRDCIMAIKATRSSVIPCIDWSVFSNCALAFVGAVADFELIRKPTAGMIINAVNTIEYLKPDMHGFFSEEVIKIICVYFREDGIVVPPPSLFDLIDTEMLEQTGLDRKLWYETYKALKKMEDIPDGQETQELIQADRIQTAEQAASTYFGGEVY